MSAKDIRRKRILITGAAGSVGSTLRPLMPDKYALRLCDLAPIQAGAESNEILQGDLAEPTLAFRAVDGVDGVVHLAGLVASEVSFEETLAPNYRAVLNLLEACRQAGVRRFVFASSHHILGLHALGRVADDAPVAPDGFYGLSKAFGEAACALYARRFGIRTLIIRIGNVFPEVTDGRRERLWLSGRDLIQLIELGLEHPEVNCDIVYGTSNCPHPFFPNDTARRLGYRPLDHAAEHRAAEFRPLAVMGAGDGAGFVGGTFAACPLPEPFRRS
jgi:uronate dehydrogenase